MTKKLEKLDEKIDQYREKSFRIAPGLRLNSQEEAVAFINERGFILFHPAKDVVLPSLWTATAGDRRVPNEHDDPGHVSWGWKDALLGERQCYYGRFLKKKMTFIALDLLPSFYRLSDNFDDYEHDFEVRYSSGSMSYEAKSIYEVLLESGPLHTLELRRRANLWGKENQYRYSKALDFLQTELMILPMGIAEAGRWNYAFIFDILPRYYPNLIDQAKQITDREAERNILQSYLRSLGAVNYAQANRLFRWQKKRMVKRFSEMAVEGICNLLTEGETDGVYQVILKELLL
jgi:hypothetical protein